MNSLLYSLRSRPNLQRATAQVPTFHARHAEAPPIVHEVLRSPGHPLHTSLRTSMEVRFGHDFGPVRVHTDAKSAKSARAVGAMAYTVGRDIVFGADQFKSGSLEGQRLLAHELTHVIQQHGATAEDSSSLKLDEPSACTEDQALRQSQGVVSSAPVPERDSPRPSPLTVQRQQIPDRPTASATPVPPSPPSPKLPTTAIGDIKELTALIKKAGDAATKDPLVTKLRDSLVKLQPIMSEKDARKSIDDAIKSLVKDGVDAGIMAILQGLAGKAPSKMPPDRDRTGPFAPPPYAPPGIPGEHIFQGPKISISDAPKVRPRLSFEYRNGPAQSYAAGASIKFTIIPPENFNKIQGTKRVVIVDYANRDAVNPEPLGPPVYLETGSPEFIEMPAPQKPGKYVVRVNTGMGYDYNTIQEFEVTTPQTKSSIPSSGTPSSVEQTKIEK